MTWHGNQALGNYYSAVKNAQVSSELLLNGISNNLGFISPDKMVIAAHSLGNMVVSNAIRGPGSMWEPNYLPWTPDQYFMLNAAVPIESYDSTQTTGSSGPMWENIRHPDWRVGGVDYEDRLTASHWHKLFLDTSTVSGDGRQYLTWRDRFAGITFATNFYSSGEEVLRNADGTLPSLTSQFMQKGPNSWTFQEMRKGTYGAHSVSLNPTHGGWEFNDDEGAPDYYENGVRLSPQQMEGVADHELREVPFFGNFVEDFEVLHNPHGHPDAITLSYENNTHYRLLSSAIPAASFAAGANEIEDFVTPETNRNIDQQTYRTSGEWPAERPNSNWLHSDLKNIAYPYVYQLFDLIVEKGNFK